MPKELRLTTTVLSGNRIEITDPELHEGDPVEVIVRVPEADPKPRRSALEIFESLPPGPRSGKTWEEIEKHLQEERDSWDR